MRDATGAFSTAAAAVEGGPHPQPPNPLMSATEAKACGKRHQRHTAMNMACL